jgi:hypothetical protein
MRKNKYRHFLTENISGKTLHEYSTIAGYGRRSIIFFGKRSRYNLISGKALAV